MPAIKPTGIKIESNTKVVATIALLICCMALAAAAFGASFSCNIKYCTRSTTIIASSTTIPMAKIKPNKVKRLIEKPIKYIPANAPTIETGTAKIGMRVALKFCKNR